MGAVSPVSVTCHELELPSRVSHEDLLALQSRLRAHAAQPVEVSARQWRSFDSLTLQFLLAAARDWSLRGQRFTVTGLSAEMATVFRLIGVRPDMLTWEQAQ
jgi:anti-anti-sigma regulatory factor